MIPNEGFRKLWNDCSLTDRIIAAFTVVLAFASIYQFIIMDGQLEEMRNDQRPWVGIKSVTVAPLAPGQYVNGVTTFANTGKSPAMDLSAIGTIFSTSDPVADLPPEQSPEGDVTHFIGTPGIDQNLAVKSTRPITQAEYTASTELNVRFYFYGHGQYKDTSTGHKIHRFQYCVFLQSKSSGITPCTGKNHTNETD